MQKVDNIAMEWARESDMAQWTLSNIDRIKSVSDAAVRKLETARNVLKQSAKLVRSAHSWMKKISNLAVDTFTGPKNLCDILLVTKFFQKLGLMNCRLYLSNFGVILRESRFSLFFFYL